ncbi:conserved hypothetical protein [Ricinus communis]|uniref:Uncharacterized protein n=1 Tax=Ricinus communis TaxID=3988 RepID=B9RT20_RICCO|nr:conserved hypothetical protein [Ricinus communis]
MHRNCSISPSQKGTLNLTTKIEGYEQVNFSEKEHKVEDNDKLQLSFSMRKRGDQKHNNSEKSTRKDSVTMTRNQLGESLLDSAAQFTEIIFTYVQYSTMDVNYISL